MSLQALSDYTTYSRYARYIKEQKRRETWEEMINRVFDMHAKKFAKQLENNEFKEAFEFAKKMVLKKRVLGSQRALQYGGDPILKKNERMFNCSSLYIDKPKAFQDVTYLLLAGCGVGFSVQYRHVNQLPAIHAPGTEEVVYQIPDSVEGWADAVGVLLASYFVDGGNFPQFKGKKVSFDYSLIRPKGALIANQFKAPGPEPLRKGLEKVRSLLNKVVAEGNSKLRPIHAYDILMHCSDFVISGGLRRSATICLFSKEDKEMISAKTGSWFIDNPQRGRSNNSVVLKRDEITTEEFNAIFESIRHYGEPGFYFVDDYDCLTNPCVEIGFFNKLKDGRTGVGFCNLTEINGAFCDSEENFLLACRASAILGTMQSAYDVFPYLGSVTEEIVRTERLLGCSITGWMDNPQVLFNEEILEKGAKLIVKENERIAALIGINPSARVTCSKPAGSTSCVLKTASGIHPHHARRYIRRVQANKQEFALQYYKKINPLAVEESVWSANKTDEVISFPCEVPKGAITKNDINAIGLLEKVKTAQQHWVLAGNVPERSLNPKVTHNISNTISVLENEWDQVRDYIYENRQWFAGISLLAASGDLDYPQAPFTRILDERELVQTYGPATIFASGLVVDGLAAFENNLWKACDCALGIGEKLEDKEEPEEPEKPRRRLYKSEKDFSNALANYAIELNLFYQTKGEFRTVELKKDWVRRFKQFAVRYFDGDLKKTSYCLKHVSSWKQWIDLRREAQNVIWEKVVEDTETFQDADKQAAAACAGGKCEV
jgi:ribonucleoside-triphosphate reductase